jgi:hypothetical protein
MPLFQVHIWVPEIIVYDPPRMPGLTYRYWDGGADDEDAAIAAARSAWHEDYGYEVPDTALFRIVDISPVSLEDTPSERRQHLNAQRQRYIDSYQCPKCGRPVLDMRDQVPAEDCMQTFCKGCNNYLVRDPGSEDRPHQRPWRLEIPDPEDIRP